jgi:hypothetical protein
VAVAALGVSVERHPCLKSSGVPPCPWGSVCVRQRGPWLHVTYEFASWDSSKLTLGASAAAPQSHVRRRLQALVRPLSLTSPSRASR